MTERRPLGPLLKEIRSCRHCADTLPHKPRPVLQAAASARIAIFGQAPGTRVHASGKPFTDPSGDRLRDWMQVEEAVFYDETKIAIIPMGFCFPGLDAKGGDKPPLKVCAELWREKLLNALPNIEVSLLVGGYAQKWHLKEAASKTLTETVTNWRAFAPRYFPTPHPSWRNNGWLRKNPWYEEELLPVMRKQIANLL